MEKLLEDALIKLVVVVSIPFGSSGRAMMAELIIGLTRPGRAGRRCPRQPPLETARLSEALTGGSPTTPPSADPVLHRIDAITTDIATAQDRIDAQVASFAPAVAHLDAVPRRAEVTAAQAILAEVGLDMSRLPIPAHLASWARLGARGQRVRRPKKGNAGTGHGDSRILGHRGECAG